MERVTVNTAPAYDVLIENGLLAQAGTLSAGVLRGDRVMLVSDDRVAPLYLDRTKAALDAAGLKTATFVFPAGEAQKSLTTVERLLEAADAAGLTRRDGFIGLGGGVVGDLTGLAAALYLRGVDVVQIPTTLLAMVDASVGGKTAVNLAAGKNLCGAFHQPRLVICDPEVLRSLPTPVYAEGMAEVIKHGALGGEALLDRIRAGEDMVSLVADNVRLKADIVSQDEKEGGLRQLLNFGHTFGHAVEKLTGFTIYHGEGVSIGMLIAALTAERQGLCGAGIYEELRALLLAQGLPVTTHFTARSIAEAAMNDKKRSGDLLTVILPKARGVCQRVPVQAASLAGLIACCEGTVTGC